ncbi:hypothetical protein SNE25_09480 [Mucilaginibacter sabulilitoris]|uniref:Uncharacterized protein n=1 Tax=Mucilaginibacter sabulilitoris TaxID=1173583 RepID=A0ABZ0TUJ4_9SPHI|nr:hypothetical protein [Mucilaginibacter sabulilitoris]WPU95748.1 hypothetical protein SNE25_09480 [Mucilaginibacter sabulilitoris]
MSSVDIQDIIDGKKGMVLITAEKIGRVFGLTYYEFGNPKYPLPAFNELPESTKVLIAERKKVGAPRKFVDHGLADALDKILNSHFLKEPHTAKEIFAQMPMAVRDLVRNAARISDLLNREPRSLLVIKFKIKGSREYSYQLIEFAGQ